MAIELAAGALIGTALNELLGAIKVARSKISSFEPILTRLESTLAAITPRIHEITLLSKKLQHHHQSGIADLIILARDGKELVAKCSNLSSYNYVKKVKYSKMLHDLDCSLLRYFDTVLQLDQLKDTKEILLVLKKLHCKLFPLDNDDDFDNKSQQIDEEIRSLSLKEEDRAEGSTSFERDYQEFVMVRNLRKNQEAATMHREVLDDIIARLLEFRKVRPAKQVQLKESEILQLCIAARDIFLRQPNLLELEAPMNICGDIHGQYGDLLRHFEYGGFPPHCNYLFLGNYVDHGKQSLETICLLLCFKIKYPENFFLLRGNHECASISRIYGFYDECKRRFNVRLWETFIDCFNCLPVAALVDNKIFCVHGGLSPELKHVHQITNIPRPTDVPDVGLLCDLLWSDPSREVEGWGMNDDRGVSYTFGPDKVSEFLYQNDMDLICRAHQVVEDGYEFFADRQLVTIFSAPNYCGEYDNAGAMMRVDESSECSFQILKPARS